MNSVQAIHHNTNCTIFS